MNTEAETIKQAVLAYILILIVVKMRLMKLLTPWRCKCLPINSSLICRIVNMRKVSGKLHYW